MNLYVLDTDSFPFFAAAGHPIVTKRCAAKSPGELAITVSSVEKQLYGRLRFIRKVRKPDDLSRAYQSLIQTLRSPAKLPIILVFARGLRTL